MMHQAYSNLSLPLAAQTVMLHAQLLLKAPGGEFIGQLFLLKRHKHAKARMMLLA
jgi:hypothetical protein